MIDFSITGYPKCATTSLSKYLMQSDDIHIATGEPHYFLRSEQYNKRQLCERDYLSLFEASNAGQLKGDHSTWYAWSQDAIANMHAVAPSARVVVLVRNPVELVQSLHHHFLHKTGRENTDSLESAYNASARRRHGDELPPKARFPGQVIYDSVAKYSLDIPRIVRTYGEPNVMIILFDDLISDPFQTTQRCLEFIGAKRIPEESKFPIHNPAVAPKSRLVSLAVNAEVGSLFRGKLDRFRIVQSLREARRWIRYKNSARADKLVVPKHLYSKIANDYAEDIEFIEDHVGRRLSRWKTFN